MGHLLTGTASLTAFVSIWTHRKDRVALGALTALTSSIFLWTLFWPHAWTPETFVASESMVGLCAVLVALGAARRAGTAPDVLFSALCLAGTAGTVGFMAFVHVPLIRNFAYRGTAFLDLAVCAVLATIAGRSVITDYLDSVSVRWLAIAFGLSAIRLLLFEVSFPLGRFAGWLEVFAWVAAMLVIARAASVRSQLA